MRARTIKEISGHAIPTIPKGTEFTILHTGDHHSSCRGLPILSIWNDEYELIPEPPAQPKVPLKRFALALLQNGGNQVFDETGPCTKAQAVTTFQNRHPHLNLNGECYAKVELSEKGGGGHITYCMAEYYQNAGMGQGWHGHHN